MVSTDVVVPKTGLPAGDYKIVAWDLDTTGRRLIDEFCHIASYTPDANFSQYVMPYKDLDIIASRRHQVRTLTLGRYRMLKDLKTGKFLKTKSEISALIDFLTWLEEIKGESNLGIILLNYENYRLTPALLLEALNKYQLLDRFKESVKGFSDCYAYVKQTCDSTLTSFSLRVVSKVLLDKDGEVASASDRARLAYEIVQHLTSGEGDGASHLVMLEAIREHTSTVEEELQFTENMKVTVQRQNTLKPVFLYLMNQSPQQRRTAIALRNLLVVALLDYNTLKSLWDEDKDHFQETVSSKLGEASEEEKKEVCELLKIHFNRIMGAGSEKRLRNPGKRARKMNAKERDQATSSDIPSTTDTTASNTTTSSPSKSNGLNTPQLADSPSPKHEPPVPSPAPASTKLVDSPKHEPTVPASTSAPAPTQVVDSPKPKPPVSTSAPAPAPTQVVDSPKPKPSVTTSAPAPTQVVDSTKPKPPVSTSAPAPAPTQVLDSPKPKPPVSTSTPAPAPTQAIDSTKPNKPPVSTSAPAPAPTQAIDSTKHQPPVPTSAPAPKPTPSPPPSTSVEASK